MNYFKLKFLLLFFALAVTIPPAWAETYTMTIDQNAYGNNNVHWLNKTETFVHEGITWNAVTDGVPTSGSKSQAQIGTKDNPATYITITTTGFAGKKIVSASLTGFCSSTTGPVLTITGGSTTMLNEKPLVKTTPTTYETTNNNITLGNNDALTFSITSSVKAGITISSITVTYEEGGDTPPAEENIYQKVTNASQLVAGKTYIIVNESANVGMGAVDDSRYGTVVTDLEFADGKVNIGGTEVMELTLGGKENAWTFMLPNSQYLAKGNNDNKFLLATSPTTNISKWTIDLSNGCSIINNDNDNPDENYRYIRYENNNNNRFDISYESNVALYVKYEGGETPQPADVTLSFPENSYTATLGQGFTAPTLSVDPADAASEVTYSSSNTDVAMVDESTGAVTLVAAGTTTITAEISGSETYKNASASYILTVSPDLSNTAVLDFNEVNYWTPNLPTDNKLVDERSFTDGAGYTVKIAGSTGNGYYWTSHYLLLGKQGAYIQLPAFNRAVKSIVVEVPGTASTNVKQNIFVGETAVSTETTGNGNHTYNISSEYQRAGNIYTLKVTNGYNTQVKKIIIHFDENSSEVPLISVIPSSVTITDATGDDKTGTISATVDPAGTVNATATEGWSATNSSVTYQGKALHAEGTATFSSTGATDVEASLEYNYTGPLYILGTVNNGGWAPNNYVAMTRGADGLYTVRVTTNAGKEGLSWISFTKRVANDADDGAWNYIRPYRFVPYSENGDAWWLTDGTVNQFNTLDFNTDHVDDQPVRMSPGTYDITINANDNTFKIEPYIVTVETPTFNPEAGSYKTFQSVTISCATEGATIHYTVDGSEPTESSPVYGDPISVKSKTTIKAIAMKSGMANSAIAEATYNLPQTVATVAEAMGVAANSYFLFTGEAVVTYAGQSTINSNYHYIFIRDKDAENGGGVIFYSTNNNVTVPSVQATNVLKRGWYAQLRPYNSWKEFQKAEFVEASGETAADDAAPFDRTGMELKYDDNVNEYVKIDNVTYNEGNITYAGQNREDVTYTYKVVNHFNVSLEDGKHYNIEGVVTRNNNTIEFYPTAATLAKQDLELAFEPTAANAYVGENVTEPALKGLPEGLAVTYSSSNTEVATVDANTGEVTAVAAGEAVITATFEGNNEYNQATATYTLTVKAKEVVTLTFDKENVELYAGQKFTAPTLSGLPEGATVTYTVTNTDPEVEVAKVENNVVVLTGNVGTATVTATYAGDASHNSATATYTITVKAKKEAGLAFDPTTATAEAGAEEFTAPTLVNPNNLSPITYKSSDENVAAFVDGVLVIGDAGETTITATFAGNEEFNEGSASYTLTVTKKDAGLKYEQAELTVYAGNDFTAPTLVNPNKLSPITYKSSDENVAMVDEKTGEVVLMDEIGNATITATFAGNGQYNEATASYTIHVIAKKTATLTFDPTQVPVYVGTEEITQPTLTTNPNNLSPITYSSDNENVAMVDDKTGEVVLMGKIGDAKITATFAGNDEYAKAEASYTITVEAKPAIIVDFENLTMTAKVGETATATFNVLGTDLKEVVTLTLNDANGVYTINPESNISIKDAEEGATVTVTYKPTQAGNDNATITIASEAAESVTVTLAGTATVPEVVAMPTFSLVAGSYTGAQTVIIYCATEGATISYSTDGGSTWTVGNTVNVDKDMTIMAKASKDGYTISETATGYYVIDIPEALPTDMPTFDGYYSVLNSGKYANIQGRKTLTFTDAPDAQAGTVIRLKSDNTGKVEVLRSQAADLQRYAYRAMDYVPDIVQIVVDKLGAEGEGHILGKDGLDAIMTKFDESFKPDLYIEKAGDNGYRIYGRTPSMQPVVDFYRENKDKVEAKLPDLVAFINSALAKLRNKANQAGMDGDNVFVDFDLKTIWTRMGGNLTDPEVDEMGFYRDVLNYKDNVWNFAYQTATFYLEKIKNTGTYTSLSEQLGEFAQYLDKIDQIHPDFKYYIVANEEVTKPDFISQGNADIINNAARTIWTIKPRTDFTVNFPKDNKHNGEYVTTLYTDFAYTLPEGVTAWAVTSVSDQGIGELTAIDGTTIAAQTPVLLKSTTAGDVATFGITTADGTAAPEGNLLVGPDYLIETYQIKTPEVVKMFEAIKTVLGENIYNDLVDKYGHLQFRTSGTVNNKYFWGLNEEEVKSCAEENPETGKKVKVVRSLGIKDDLLGFNDNEHVYTNKALLVSTEHSAINFSLRGDINKDGVISIIDVTALIDILLDLPARNYLEPTTSYPKGLDYEAANVNENEEGIEITDVTTLIDILLNMPDQPAQGSGN